MCHSLNAAKKKIFFISDFLIYFLGYTFNNYYFILNFYEIIFLELN